MPAADAKAASAMSLTRKITIAWFCAGFAVYGWVYASRSARCVGRPDLPVDFVVVAFWPLTVMNLLILPLKDNCWAQTPQ